MIKNIVRLLSDNPLLTDYKLNITKKESNELFFVHKDLETVRATKTTDIKVTVYVEHDGKMGDSTFSVYASTTEGELIEKINSAVDKAMLINNEYYKLPSGDIVESETLQSNFLFFTMNELAEKIANAAFEADCYKDGSINALEVFVNKYEITVINSKGINKTEIKYDAMIEAIPTWNKNDESVELYEAYKFNSFDEEAITKEINEKMLEVKARYEAVKPNNEINCNVILRAFELRNLFDEYAYQANYSLIYQKTGLYKKGDLIQDNPINDKINLTLKGQIKGSSESALFDSDGVTFVDTKIIEDGKIVENYGSNRFAQYLNANVTGMLPCMEIDGGNTPLSDFNKEPYFECVSMSGLQVDLYNDYIGGEVRLGYYYDGNSIIPVTGISISGKLSDAMNNIILSKEVKQVAEYLGPEKALFKGIKVV